MKRYQIQVESVTLVYGVRTYEVEAESEAKAKELYYQRSVELVDEFDNKSESQEKNMQIISESIIPESLLDHME